MRNLEDSLGQKQKELLQDIRQKNITKIENSFEWRFVYQSIKTFQCLGLVDFNNTINYWEQLKELLEEQANG